MAAKISDTNSLAQLYYDPDPLDSLDFSFSGLLGIDLGDHLLNVLAKPVLA